MLQADHDEGDDEHDPEAGEGGRDVQRVDAAERDRHEQRDPEDQVEHDGRGEAGRGQGEAGVGAADARQREQPVARAPSWPRCRRARCCDSALVLIWMRNIRSRDTPPRLVAERRPGQQRVGEPRRDLQRQAEHQERRVDPGELVGGVAEARDQRQDEDVDDDDERGELQRQAHRTEARPLDRPRRVALDRRELTRLQRRGEDGVVVVARRSALAADVTAPSTTRRSRASSRSRTAASVLPRWTIDGVFSGQDEHVLTLVAVGGERGGVLGPHPPVAPVVVAVLGVVGDERAGVVDPARGQDAPVAVRRRRAGTARRSGRTGGPGHRRRTSRPSCRRRRTAASASVIPVGPNRRWSRNERIAASRSAGAASAAPATRSPRTRETMFVVPDE